MQKWEEERATAEANEQKRLEDWLRECRENEKKKSEEMYKVKKEFPPKYTL